ncbi:hypothetical protein MRB53_027255 [Persea americana]|uniref:Uncharacterized protein n=1 Tax=Persea americana TaxID=3435 RepID=A0ACC2LKG5_PERAE|nr:hypothetical protein MRB53_027255 [Persea americana]
MFAIGKTKYYTQEKIEMLMEIFGHPESGLCPFPPDRFPRNFARFLIWNSNRPPDKAPEFVRFWSFSHRYLFFCSEFADRS